MSLPAPAPAPARVLRGVSHGPDAATAAQLKQAVEARVSCRKFEPAPLPPEVLDFARTWLDTPGNLETPLGSQPRPTLLTDTAAHEDTRISTYGYVQDFPAALAVVSANTPDAIFDVGYATHGAVLELVHRGLSTVWIGGAFNQSDVLRNIPLREGDVVAALVPFGLPAGRRHLRAVLIPKVLGATKRKPVDEVCFFGDFAHPVGNHAPTLRGALDVARRAPSAKNKQSWRLLVSDDGNHIHIYAHFTQRANVGTGWRDYACPPEYLDVGIYLRSLVIALACDDIYGSVHKGDPVVALPAGADMEYVATWTRQDSDR